MKEKIRVFNIYETSQFLGSGSFGKIYEATNVQTNERVAIKFESLKGRHSQLRNEYKVLSLLNGEYGIPKVYKFGTEGDFNIMIMQLLGPSLETLFQSCDKKFSVETVNQIGFQVVRAIYGMQQKSYLHRDIKADNLLVGLGKNCTNIYLIDFGLAKPFIDPATKTHIFFRRNKDLVGTARYASINTHEGQEQSRRDDIESLMYVLVYFLKGCLPWQGLNGRNKNEKYYKIMNIKQKEVPYNLCKELPPSYFEILNYTRNLKFLDSPNYDYILSCFQNPSFKGFDWISKKHTLVNKLSPLFYDLLFNYEENSEIEFKEKEDTLKSNQKNEIYFTTSSTYDYLIKEKEREKEKEKEKIKLEHNENKQDKNGQVQFSKKNETQKRDILIQVNQEQDKNQGQRIVSSSLCCCTIF